MKNTNLQNLIKEVKKVSLTSEEKSGLSAKLNTYINAHSPKPKQSPYFSYFHFSKTFTYAFTSVALIILIGGSAVSASGKALPGDLLYPIKVHVSEPIQSAMATTPEAKQLVQVAHIEERLNEAEILAVEGRLATTTEIEIQQNVADRIKLFDNKLSKQDKDDLEIKVSAHSIVLKNIRDTKPQAMSAKVMITNSEVKVLEGKDAEREIKVRKEVENIDRKIEKRRGRN